MKPSEKVSRAKAMLILEQPFIAAIICGMKLVEDRNLPFKTLATDGKYVWYDPDFVDGLSLASVMWCLAHETMHNVFAHAFRREGRNPRLWNIAGDYVINQLLEVDMPRMRPDNVLFDKDIYERGNRTTEGIYALLLEDAEKNGGGGPDQWDEVLDHGGTAAEQAEAAAVWKVTIAQAASAAKARGKLSADMERLVGAILQPAVCWEDQLRQFCMKRIKSSYSYARPARRHLHAGLYMPGKDGNGMGEIMVAIDVSGSVDDKTLTRFNTELQAIVEDAHPDRVHVIYFHHMVERHDTFEFGEEVTLARTGSGGTAFSPIFEFAEREGINPACCVVLTDLLCSDFGPAPDYAVMWASTHSMTAPWGEVIDMRGAGGK